MGPFESAVKNGASACGCLQEDQDDNLSPTERLTAKADGLAECTASLEKIVEAAKTLYGSLGEGEVHCLLGDNRPANRR